MERARAEMLHLVNQARAENGVSPVSGARSQAPQLHAEECAHMGLGSHWNQAGLKPYMRASLASECQATAENVFSFRTKASHQPQGLMWVVAEAMKGLMNSPGHRRTILNPDHRLLSTGLAQHQGTFTGVQQFDGDYLRLAGPPRLDQGFLSLQISLLPPARATSPADLQLAINYDPPPTPLQPAQLLRVNPYSTGEPVLLVRPPAPLGAWYTEATAHMTRRIVHEPAEYPAETEMPRTLREWENITRRAYDQAKTNREEPRVVPWADGIFELARPSQARVQADLRDTLRRHGPGVYTVEVWASATDRPGKMLAGQHSLFVQEQSLP